MARELPPKEWFYYATERIKKKSYVYDPKAVAGQIWWSMVPSTKAKIMSFVKKQRARGKMGVITSTGPKTKAQVQKVIGKRATARLYKKLKLYKGEIAEAKRWLAAKRKRKVAAKKRPKKRKVAANPRRAPKILWDVVNLAPNTISILTGHKKYSDIDKAHGKFVQFVQSEVAKGKKFKDWMAAWKAYSGEDPIYALKKKRIRRRNPLRAGICANRRTKRRRNPELMLLTNPRRKKTRKRPRKRKTRPNSPTLAQIKRMPGYRAALRKYRQFHGTEPVEIVMVDIPYKCPKFMVVLGDSPEAVYKVPKHSKKRMRDKLPYKHDYTNRVVKATDATGKSIMDIALTEQTKVTDWIHG